MREYVNIFKVAPRDAFELQCVQFSRVIARFNKTGNNSNAKKSRRKPAPTNEEDIQKVRDEVKKILMSAFDHCLQNIKLIKQKHTYL